MSKIIIIGHCCLDEISENKFVPGGTAYYSCKIAEQFDFDIKLITSWGPNYEFGSQLSHLSIDVIDSQTTTVFKNLDLGEGKRKQYLKQKAKTLFIPEKNFEYYDIAFFTPICNEVPFELIGKINARIKVATIQGWLRQVNGDMSISPKSIDWSLLADLNIVIASQQDFSDFNNDIKFLRKYVEYIIITKGDKGCVLYKKDKEIYIEAYPVNEIDSTGAGDIFSMAFLFKHNKGFDLRDCCIFGNCAASFIVEGKHITNLPSLADIEARVLSYKKNQK
jgi:sugar/nucleoside kinase (ribokinase family)